MGTDRLGTITLLGLTATGYHGVLESERVTGQPFIVDLTVEVDMPATDEIAGAVDYSRLAHAVLEIVTGAAVDLIETLAQRIADRILADRRIHRVQVRVHKPHAPIDAEFTDVSVTISRSNDD